MAKLKNTPIGSPELIQYLETSSDFAFELRCMERISQIGFRCLHGGSYTDPVTKKSRQFDIRAYRSDGVMRVWCAVECKNLSNSFPLLVMCVPRLPEESFHELVLSYSADFVEQSAMVPAFADTCHTVHVREPDSAYMSRGPVGKSCAQVGKAFSDDSLVANDTEVYEKWSQALASAADLAHEAAQEGDEHGTVALTLILPVVVVPDGTLWKVDYHANGANAGDPKQSNRCSFFVGQDYVAGEVCRQTCLCLSHLEFVTFSGLDRLMKEVAGAPDHWFPDAAVEQAEALLPRGYQQ